MLSNFSYYIVGDVVTEVDELELTSPITQEAELEFASMYTFTIISLNFKLRADRVV